MDMGRGGGKTRENLTKEKILLWASQKGFTQGQVEKHVPDRGRGKGREERAAICRSGSEGQ